MKTFEAIQRRRSARRLTPEPIPTQHLEKIVDAGRLAATAHNAQPWDFVAVSDRKTIAELGEVNGWMKEAGAVIALVVDPTTEYWRETGAAAAQNMLIACTALEYGSCWVQGDARFCLDDLKELLGIPPNRFLLILVAIGKAETWPPVPDKRELVEVLHWEHWGQRTRYTHE